jgi:hypothetical protein
LISTSHRESVAPWTACSSGAATSPEYGRRAGCRTPVGPLLQAIGHGEQRLCESPLVGDAGWLSPRGISVEHAHHVPTELFVERCQVGHKLLIVIKSLVTWH